VRALRLRPGRQAWFEIGCGTGTPNFPSIERGDRSRLPIVGVDLTDAMLAQAQQRIESNGWSTSASCKPTRPRSFEGPDHFCCFNFKILKKEKLPFQIKTFQFISSPLMPL